MNDRNNLNYQHFTNGLRMVGRTHRMLQAVAAQSALLGKGRMICVLASTVQQSKLLLDRYLRDHCGYPVDVKSIHRGERSDTVKATGRADVKFLSINSGIVDPIDLRVQGVESVFVDHYAIESKFANVLHELHRYNEPPRNPALEQMAADLQARTKGVVGACFIDLPPAQESLAECVISGLPGKIQSIKGPVISMRTNPDDNTIHIKLGVAIEGTLNIGAARKNGWIRVCQCDPQRWGWRAKYMVDGQIYATVLWDGSSVPNNIHSNTIEDKPFPNN